MTLPRATRPTPPAILAFPRPPAPAPEPSLLAEIRARAGWQLAGLAAGNLVACCIWGAPTVGRVLWATLTGQPL